MGFKYDQDVKAVQQRMDPVVVEQTQLVKIRGEFWGFHQSLEKLEAGVPLAIKIEDDKSMAYAVELAGKFRGVRGSVEKKRKKISEPIIKLKKEIDSLSKAVKDRCWMNINKIDRASAAWMKKKDDERIARQRAAAEAAQREAEAARKRHAAAVEKARSGAAPLEVEEPAPVVVPEVIAAETKISTGSGSMAMKTEKVPEIVNLAAAVADPDFIRARGKFLSEQVMVYARQCLKFGKTNVPGIVFKDVRVVRGRAK